MSEQLPRSSALRDNEETIIDTRARILHEIYDLRIDIQKLLLIVGSRQTQNKRIRTEVIQQQLKRRRFRQALATLQSQWEQLSENFFRTKYDSGTYEKVAHDLIKAVNKYRKELNVFDEYIRMLVGVIIKPVIAAIMEEEELNRSSRHRQERRKSFIEKLLRVQLDSYSTWFTQEELDAEQSNTDDSIDVCSLNPNIDTGTASRARGPISQRTRAATSLPANIAFRPNSLECNFEKILLLDFLFDALSIHTKNVCNERVDFERYIYHIMNITYIVDILVTYLKDMHSELEEARSRRMILPMQQCIKLITEALPRYETSIRDNIDSFDMNPLIIFRKDLNKILSILIIIRSEIEN